MYWLVRMIIVLGITSTLLSDGLAQDMKSQTVSKRKARMAAKGLFAKRNGWIEVVVKSPTGPEQLGAPRVFYIHRAKGSDSEILVVDQWTVARLRVCQTSIVFDYRDRYKSGFAIRVMAPLEANTTALESMQAVNLPELRVDTLRMAVLNAIDKTDRLVLSHDGQCVELHSASTKKRVVAYLRWTDDTTPPTGLADAQREFDGRKCPLVRADDPSRVFDEFFGAVQNWAKPVLLTPASAEILLKKHGLFYPSHGNVSGVLMYRNLSMIEIRIVMGEDTFPIVASRGLKRSFIPKDFVDGTRKSSGYEFVRVVDSGTKKQHLYWFGEPFSLFCPIASEADEEVAARLMSEMATNMLQNRQHPNRKSKKTKRSQPGRDCTSGCSNKKIDPNEKVGGQSDGPGQ